MSTVYIYAVLLNFDLYLFVINDKLNNNVDVITEIEINGAKNIKEIYKESV